jgi:Protein required for attachment to host cells
LKAYRVNETLTRGPSLKLVQAFDVTDAHGKLVDKVTDLAGRYAANDGAGMHQASISETKLETETERRINKQLADQITKIAKSDGVEGWSFAAPASCHNAIIELLPPEVRGRIVEFVKSDLVKMEAAKLASHFRSLQPI